MIPINPTPEEVQKIYREIQEELVKPFPPGTVESRENDSKSKYIPVQPYINRLEEAAGTFWSWHITREPHIFEKEDQIMIRGVLKIVEAEREGIGFSNLQRYPDSGKIKNLKYAISAAASDALRDACDKYKMGWVDLKDYRQWANNPGTGLNTSNSISVTDEQGHFPSVDKCVKCGSVLTDTDREILKEFNIKLLFCQEHIPNHFRK